MMGTAVERSNQWRGCGVGTAEHVSPEQRENGGSVEDVAPEKRAVHAGFIVAA
jgi:hypothetical protein